MKKIILGLCLTASFSYGLTIEDAVKTAIENNPVIKQRLVQQQIAHHKTKEIKASRYGKIDAFVNYTHYNIPRLVAPISPPLDPMAIAGIVGAKNITIPGIRYDVPLFTGFKIEKSVEISKLGEKLSEIAVNLTKNQIAFNIRSIYLKILTLKKQLEAMEHYKKALDQLYDNISMLYELGKKPEVDLLKVEYAKKTVESNIEAINNAIDTLKETLRTLMNTEDKDFEVEPVPFRDIGNVSKEELMKVYFPKLYSVKKVEIQKQISQKKLEQSKSDYYPNLFFSGQYQRNIGNGVNKELWQVSLIAKYTIFDFGSRSNRKIESQLNFKKTLLEEQKVKLDVERKLTYALNQIKTADFKIKATKKQLDYATEVEKVEKLKYEEGLSSLYDYLYAQSQKYIAESKYYEALYEKQRAIYYLDYVLEKGF